MSEGRRFPVGPWAVLAVYLAVGLEVIVMITPFAAYFYSVYAPILGWLEAHRATAWLTAFFLPHIADTGDPLLGVLSYLGPVLLALGLGIFLAGAFQVYSAKLFRRGVVTGGLYAAVRHPQYLGLAVAGLGLLLYWPRFLILVLYVTMLFAYGLLARHEERRMARCFGDSYHGYAGRLPMFVPGAPGERLYRRLTRGRPAGPGLRGAAFAAALGLSLAAAVGLRAYSHSRLTTVREGNVVAVAVTPGDEGTLRARLRTALADPAVAERVEEHPATHTLVAYVLPQDYMMQHLIADLGEHEAHHGGGDEPGLIAALRHLGQMYALRPLRQLGSGAGSPRQRVIFTEARTPDGSAVPPGRALAADVLRFPFLFADLEGDRVTMAMEVPPRHGWGTIPVPAF